MRKLYIIRAHKCGDGCRQYTRQDTGDFIDEKNIRALPIPPRIIERNYDNPLEQDDFFYIHDDISSEANALLYEGRRLEKENSIIYAASYFHLQRVEDFCYLKKGEPCEMERMRR